MPAAVLKTLPFDPALPGDKRAALARLPIATAAKLFVPLAAPTEPSATLSVPERYWAWTALGADGVVTPVVNCFAGLAGRARAPPRRRGPGDLGRVARGCCGPDLALHARRRGPLDVGRALVAAASTRVSSPAAQPGATRTRSAAARARSSSAASTPAGDDGGLMEGALRSGLRAAEVVESLRVIAELTRAVGAEHVITDPPGWRPTSATGSRLPRDAAAVVLPATADEVAACVRACPEAGVPFVARGAGTGLSGGALPRRRRRPDRAQRLRASSRSTSVNQRVWWSRA